jgi:RHH-type rel operon transcriptional repressor/antitoxin RelB
MSATTTLTIRVPTNLKRRLDRLAKQSKLSKSWLATDAVQQYVDEQERQAILIERADKEVDAGRFVPHSDVRQWLLSWGSKKELPPPACK